MKKLRHKEADYLVRSYTIEMQSWESSSLALESLSCEPVLQEMFILPNRLFHQGPKTGFLETKWKFKIEKQGGLAFIISIKLLSVILLIYTVYLRI